MRYSVVLLILCAFLGGSIAQASGMTLHMFMSDLAAKEVKDPELGELLEKHKNTIRNGVIFPDSGYVRKGSYGEFAHWHEFHNGYAMYLDRTCAAPLTSECEALFAFFLGSLAHALGDVNFDRFFVQELARLEFNGSMDKAQTYTDPGMDMLAIFDYDRGTVVPKKSVPKAHLQNIFNSLGWSVTKKDISLNTGLLYALFLGERAGAPFAYPYYSLKSKWAPKNYYTAKGGVQDSAKVISSMWDEIWSRWKRDQRFLNIAKLKSTGVWPNVDFYIEN